MPRVRVGSLLAVLLLAGSASFAASAAPARDVCAAPEDVLGSISAIPSVAAVLKPGGQLHVLAVGSATMFGPEASFTAGTLTGQPLPGSSASAAPITQPASDRAFPRQMAKSLQDLVPKLEVDVSVRGGRGMTAADMLGLLRKELVAGRYQLVLWQTGTVEAVRNSPPGEFAQVLSDGAAAVEAAGANLVLIDPQYSRFLQTNSNMDPYNQALQQAASMPGVLLFHRFDLMRNWANEGQIDLERTQKGDRKRVGDALHACLGAQLARMVFNAARS